MRKSEKNAFFSKPFNGRILISSNLILYTFLCMKIKKFTIGNFFLLMHVLVPCELLRFPGQSILSLVIISNIFISLIKKMAIFTCFLRILFVTPSHIDNLLRGSEYLVWLKLRKWMISPSEETCSIWFDFLTTDSGEKRRCPCY